MRYAILTLLATWFAWAIGYTCRAWLRGEIYNDSVFHSISYLRATGEAFVYGLFQPMAEAMRLLYSARYVFIVGLYPFALLCELIRERCATGKWKIDWLIHPWGVLFAALGAAVIPLMHFAPLWMGLTALILYVFPILAVVVTLIIIARLERDESAEIEYDDEWCCP